MTGAYLNIEMLRELIGALSDRDVTLEQLVERLGQRPVDLQGNVLVQAPSLPGVQQASVVRQMGAADEVAMVSLQLAAPLALSDLESAFGAPNVVAGEHPGQPRSAVFMISGAHEFDVRLIATVGADLTSRTITLARDVKLAS